MLIEAVSMLRSQLELAPGQAISSKLYPTQIKLDGRPPLEGGALDYTLSAVPMRSQTNFNSIGSNGGPTKVRASAPENL